MHAIFNQFQQTADHDHHSRLLRLLRQLLQESSELCVRARITRLHITQQGRATSQALCDLVEGELRERIELLVKFIARRMPDSGNIIAMDGQTADGPDGYQRAVNASSYGLPALSSAMLDFKDAAIGVVARARSLGETEMAAMVAELVEVIARLDEIAYIHILRMQAELRFDETAKSVWAAEGGRAVTRTEAAA